MNWRQRFWSFVLNGVRAIARLFVVPTTTDTHISPPTIPNVTLPPNVSPQPEPPAPPPPPKYDWSTPLAARHSVRVICDEEGLPLARNIEVNGKLYQLKDILCACVMQESRFRPLAIGKVNTDGTQDFGIGQFNNGKNKKTGQPYWIGKGAAFSSVQEVLDDPEKNIRIMARCFKAGQMSLWSSYKYNQYQQWL